MTEAEQTNGGHGGSASIVNPGYWWYVARADLLEVALRQFVEGSGTALDLGSADGPSAAWLRDAVDRSFRHVAEAKHLPLNVHFAEGLPRSLESDPKRLQQILKNLISNAIKFTARGHVEVRVDLAAQGFSPDIQF